MTPFSRKIIEKTYSILTNRLVYHGLFWLALFGILLFFDRDSRGWWFSYSNELINLIFFSIIVYFNLLWLIPNFLAKNRVFLYLILLILTVLLITPLKMIVFFFKFNGLPNSYQANLVVNQSNYFWANGLIAAASTMLKIITDWFRSQQEKQRLVTQNMQSELRFLRAQINPHFLFNTLNSLYALTLKKSDVAPEIVLKLSEIMRYMLYECNEKQVFLSKEIQYIQNHLALERLRLAKNLDIKFTVEGAVNDQQIAPLMFIPFLENAFKHGLANHLNKGFCHINMQVSPENIEFFIENSKPDRILQTEHPESGGIGLTNIRQRLALLYPENHELTIRDLPDRFEVNLKINL